jgi:hypothetical protein
MADEASIRSGLSINKGNVKYRSYPDAFTADVSGEKGPSPGALAVTQNGVDVDLSEITSPGFCRVSNQGSVTLMLGVWDGSALHPLKDILSGEHYVFRLSQFLGDQFGTATSTATTGDGDTLRLKSIGGAGTALVEVFER